MKANRLFYGRCSFLNVLSYKVVYKIWGRIVREIPTGRLSHSLGTLNSQPWAGGNCCFEVWGVLDLRLSAGRWVGSPNRHKWLFFRDRKSWHVPPPTHDIFIFHQSFWSITMEHQIKKFWSDLSSCQDWGVAALTVSYSMKSQWALVKNIPKSFLDWVSNK